MPFSMQTNMQRTKGHVSMSIIPGRFLVVAALATAFMASSTLAAGPSGADSVKARIAHMKAMGGSAKAIGDQLKSGSADMAVVRAEAAKVAAAAQAMPTWFPKGSGPEAGVKTRALPAIWTDSAGFSAALQAFQAQAAKVNATAAGGDAAALGPEVGKLFGGCKGCHDKYRGPEA